MPAPEPQTTPEQNKHLMRRWFDEVWNQGNQQTIHELFAMEATLYDGAQPITGRSAFLEFFNGLQAQFSDFRVTPGACLAEDDLAALRWSVECRHKASGKTVHLTGMSIVRVRDGQFVEAWQNWDQAGVAAQLSA